MTKLRTWWHAKTTAKKQNWLLLALGVCFVASGFVEYYSWMAIAGIVPAAGLVYLECWR